MARAKNPDRIPRETMVSRTCTETKWRITYVPTDSETVNVMDYTTILGEPRAKAEMRKLIKPIGTLIGMKKVSEEKALYGVTVEFFMEHATRYDIKEVK